MSLQAVVVTWEGLRKVHDAGGDPAEDRKLQRTSVKEAALARRPPVLSSWRSKFGGIECLGCQAAQELDAKNTRLKKRLAESLLENKIAKDDVGGTSPTGCVFPKIV
ncbi:hypothetical protein [Vogesella alkaliphila]|uniref:Transposase n=1 Tax=Vogesella alkaliphila TaxID=1193621 RepID=A0ABQ2YH96_9NEIS|nr:hypothetical protein [Vogesella alkaliphila]GGX83596.1 hypothetical protein GCM10011290_09060 [Vogesella alkaliphila]